MNGMMIVFIIASAAFGVWLALHIINSDDED